MDGNGSISRDEMYQIVNAIFAMTGDTGNDIDVTTRVNTIFALMDTDGDGEVSRAEFMEGARQDKSIVEAFSVYDGIV